MNPASGVGSETRTARELSHADASSAGERWPWAAIALLLTAGFFLRLLFYTGPIGSDDVGYFRYAQKLLAGESFAGAGGAHQGGRLAFLLLIGLPAAWFEHIHFGAFTNVLLLSIRDVVITFFAFRTIGAAPAAFAAAFLSLNSLSVLYAGVMVPDGMTSFAMIACTLAAYRALRSPDRQMLSWLFISGALAAIGYSAKDSGILVLAPTGLAILYWCTGRAKLYGPLAFGLGFGLLVGLEMLALWKLSGDPLFRVHAVADVHNQGMGGGRDFIEFARHVYWNLYGQTRPLAASLPVLVLLLPVTVVALFDRTRMLLIPVTGLFVALYLLFGTTSLTRLIPVPAQDRYLEPIVPYVALCLAMASRLLWRVRRRLMLPALVAFSGALVATAAPSVAYNAGDITFAGAGRNTAIAMEMAMDLYPDLAVYAPPDLVGYRLKSFSSPESYRRLQAYPQFTPLPPGLYLMHPWHNLRQRESDEVNQDLQTMPLVAVIERDQRTVSFLKLPPKTQSVRAEVRIRVP